MVLGLAAPRPAAAQGASPNDWRRLKTATSYRTVPMWPQLEAGLRQWVLGTGRPPGKLLFASYRTGQEALVTDFRKLLDGVAVRPGRSALERGRSE
jgi:hypothetical protein